MLLTEDVSRLSGADVDPAIAPENQHLECEMDLEPSAMAQRCPAFLYGEPLAGLEQMAAAASPLPSADFRPASLAAPTECVSGHRQSRSGPSHRPPNAVLTDGRIAPPPITRSGAPPHALEGGQRQQGYPT